MRDKPQSPAEALAPPVNAPVPHSVKARAEEHTKRVLFTCNRADFDARELLHGVTSHPAANDWILRVHHWPNTLSEWTAWLDGFQPHGIVIFSPISPEIHKNLRRGGLPHLFLTWGNEPLKIQDCVLLPNEEAVGSLAARHFLDRRFEHFAVVSYVTNAHIIKRKKGFLSVLRDARNPVHIYDGNVEDAPLKPYGEHIPEDFYQWLEKLPRPCALFAGNDEIGVVTIEACRHLGISVPREIAVLGAGNDCQACRIILPRLSSVDVPFLEIGREAAGILDRWMNGSPPKPGLRLYAPKEIVVRTSSELLETKDRIVTTAVEYIATHFDGHLRVTDLQRHTGVSAKTLETRFKNELRRTPVEEIRRQRIEHAKKLLRETDLNVRLVAQKCGFKQAHKFSTIFKAATSSRPSEYRRTHQDSH